PYAAVFSFFSLVKLRNYLYTDFDLAIFVQATNSLLHGSFYSSIAGLNLLGAHSALGLALIAPLFAIVRHPATLLVVQSVALGLGALPVHRLARRVLGSGHARAACGALGRGADRARGGLARAHLRGAPATLRHRRGGVHRALSRVGALAPRGDRERGAPSAARPGVDGVHAGAGGGDRA